jgi:hypothetical protein
MHEKLPLHQAALCFGMKNDLGTTFVETSGNQHVLRNTRQETGENLRRNEWANLFVATDCVVLRIKNTHPETAVRLMEQ